MKAKFVLAVVLTIAPCVSSVADTATAGRQDSEAIRAVFSGLTQAWRAGDGAAWGAAFVPDADFTVWFGLQLQGRDAIAEGHQFIFDRFYAGTSYELEIQKIRFLSPTAAVVHLTGSVVSPGESLPAEPDSVPLAVLHKTAGQWMIATFQNTPFAVEQYGRNGDLRLFKQRSSTTEEN